MTLLVCMMGQNHVFRLRVMKLQFRQCYGTVLGAQLEPARAGRGKNRRRDSDSDSLCRAEVEYSYYSHCRPTGPVTATALQ
jgi:hypothetical protein